MGRAAEYYTNNYLPEDYEEEDKEMIQGKERNLEEIKKWLLKHEFIERQSTPGVFIKNNVPNQRLVDLTKEEPQVCVFDGKERGEWESSGILEMQDIYNGVMLLWNTKYKEKEQKPESKPEQKLPFACHDCEAGITAEQRAASFKAHGMALCTDCESKHQNANDKTSGEKSDTTAPPPPVSTPDEQSSSPAITHEGVFSDEVAIAGAIQHIIKEGVKSSEQIGEVVLYWCGGDKKRAERLISQIVVGVASVQKTKEKPKSKEKEKPKEKPKEAEVVDPAKEKPGEPPKVEKPGENLPARQEGQPLGKPRKTDQELDDEINKAKARRWLRGQGDTYTVSGKERPDSAMIQKIANEAKLNIEILIAEQTEKHSHVVVRGHLGEQYIDAVVHHDFDTEFLLKTMEIIDKNPQILDHWEGTQPVMKPDAKIKQGDTWVDAKYYLVHALLSFKKFSLRDATTKAMSIVETKLLNGDWRDEEEKASEQAERELVEKSKRR